MIFKLRRNIDFFCGPAQNRAQNNTKPCAQKHFYLGNGSYMIGGSPPAFSCYYEGHNMRNMRVLSLIKTCVRDERLIWYLVIHLFCCIDIPFRTFQENNLQTSTACYLADMWLWRMMYIFGAQISYHGGMDAYVCWGGNFYFYLYFHRRYREAFFDIVKKDWQRVKNMKSNSVAVVPEHGKNQWTFSNLVTTTNFNSIYV